MKEDRRVVMTKKLLRESIFEILKLKPLSKISIKEICDNADINRTTFYKYYGDQYALIKEAEDELFMKTSEFVMNLRTVGDRVKVLETFLLYIKQNDEMFKTVLDKNNESDFRRRLMDIAFNKVLIENVDLGIKSENKLYVYTFIAMGSISMLEAWIGNYEKDATEMASLLYNFVSGGLKQINES